MVKKQIVFMAVLCMVFALTACGNAGEKENAAENTESAAPEKEGEDPGNSADEGMGEQGGLDDIMIEHSAAVVTVIAKTWNVEGTEEIYVFSPDGSGERSRNKETEAFQYTCGFDEENNILLQIMTGDKEEVYQIASDETGYGLYMEPAEGGGEKRLLTPADLEILDTEDERVAGIVGIWEDDSENRYEFTEDNKFLILTAEDNNGTFTAVEKAGEEVREISIFVTGGILQYEYQLQDDGQTLELYNRDAESYYYWHKQP